MSSRNRVIAALAAVYVIWGSTYLAIRYTVQTIPPFLAGGTRFLAAGAVLYVLGRRATGERPSRAEWRGAVLVGGALLFAGDGAGFWGEAGAAPGGRALRAPRAPARVVPLDGWWP